MVLLTVLVMCQEYVFEIERIISPPLTAISSFYTNFSKSYANFLKSQANNYKLLVYNYFKTTNTKPTHNNYFSSTKQVRIKKARIKLKNIDQFLNKVIYLINITKENPYTNMLLPPKKSIKASVQKDCCINSSHSPNLSTVNTNKIKAQKRPKKRHFNIKLTEGR